MGLGAKPFRLACPDAALADLKERLARTRWPERAAARAVVAREQACPISKICLTIGGPALTGARRQSAHQPVPAVQRADPRHRAAFHPRAGRGADSMPLLLSTRLAGLDRRIHHDHPAPPPSTSTVVAPSLPATRSPSGPGRKRFGIEDIADTFAELMTEVLGYQRFGAQGGDWGGSFLRSGMEGIPAC